MHFSKNFFFILLAIATVHSHQLHAMENAMITMLEESKASDFQIYQLLSAATKDNNSELYLPDEVVGIIATNVFEITEKLCEECYQKYGEHLRSPHKILDFIKGALNKSIPHMTIVDILKTCLSYSGKSLNTIKNTYGQTVLHYFNFSNHTFHQFRQDYITIICLIAGNQAWNLITERDDYGCTALHYCCEPYISELLNTAPNSQDAWLLINTRNTGGQTALGLANQYERNIAEMVYGSRKVIEIFESYRPKEHQ